MVQYGIDALNHGSIYALCSLGIALVFGVMGLINFAHGELMMIGGFVLVVLTAQPLWIAAIFAVLGVAACALAIERAAFRPVRKADGETMLVTSFAVSFLLQGVAILAFGSLGRSVSVLPALSEQSVAVGGVDIRLLDVVTIGTTIVMLVLLLLFLRSRWGVQMRAAAENFGNSQLIGVRANRVIGAAFAVSGVLAAVTAVILAAQRGLVDPTFGTTTMLMAFIAVILGGIGSVSGAVVGAYLLGAISVAFQALLPSGVRPFRDAFIFGFVVLVLVVRPQGLLPNPYRQARV